MALQAADVKKDFLQSHKYKRSIIATNTTLLTLRLIIIAIEYQGILAEVLLKYIVLYNPIFSSIEMEIGTEVQ